MNTSFKPPTPYFSMNPLSQTALEVLPYLPSAAQTALISAVCSFISSSRQNELFVLNGYAGTGKTSIIGAIIKALKINKKKIVLLAPTGRAAKVAGRMANHESFTIHKRLFRFVGSDPTSMKWFMTKNTEVNTIFFIDEASLIPDTGKKDSLLELIIQHVYSAPGCKIIFIGDMAQLPPVGQTESYAMNSERLKQLGVIPICFTLDEPVRQAIESGILYNATKVRENIFRDASPTDFKFTFEKFTDVVPVESIELDQYLSDSYEEVGQQETLIITRSNRRANQFNAAVRNMVLGADCPLQAGDRIIISKNDYFWRKKNKLGSFIANGDLAIVTWVGKNIKEYGRYFAEVELLFPSDGTILNAEIMLRSLNCDGPAISREEMNRLFNIVIAGVEGTISEKIRYAEQDCHYNSLQAKYAYCVTCHKAQGGQWKHIYIDLGSISKENINKDFYRWLYTALTRATEKVFLINAGGFINSEEEV